MLFELDIIVYMNTNFHPSKFEECVDQMYILGISVVTHGGIGEFTSGQRLH